MIKHPLALLLCSASLLACSTTDSGPSLDNGYGTGSALSGTGGLLTSTGGMATTGGAYATGGAISGTGGSVAPPGGGYVETGNWHGYAWASANGTGSTIAPADFSARPVGAPFPLCASGSVGAMADYSGVAMIGINLNQGTGSTDPTNTIVPTGDGITVNVSNPGDSTLRLQIQGPTGATNANDRWCATIEGSGGTIPWSAFNTECWEGGAGTDYAMQPITAALVLVPGGNETATAFDFCVNSLSEAGIDVGGTGGASTGGASTGGASTGGTSTGGASTGGASTGGTSTGGASTGGASSGGGGTGGTPSYDGGYLTFGPWHGYAWTYASGTGSITPSSYSITEPPVCASGTVAAGTSNSAMVGINLNQVKGDNPPLGTVSPTKEGILVNVTNSGGSPLRLQIQTANGAENANERWCAPLSAGQSFIPWDAFTTTCWNATGTKYANQPIVAAIVLVPGTTTTRSFNFCLNSIEPADDPAGPGGAGCDISGSPGSGSGSLSAFTGEGSWAYVAGNRYAVQNNVWNGGGAQHVVSYSGASFTVTTQTGNQPTNGAPVSFPSVFIGSNYNRATTGSNMPRQVSSLTSVPTGLSWTSASGEYNTTYDVYFSTNAGGDAGSPSGGFLMVWLHKPANAQPVGSIIATVPLANRNWNVWYGTQHEGKPVISYTAQTSVNSLSFDLLDFIKDAVGRSKVNSSWYLTNIMAGFEIWNGGQGLKVNNFCAVVN